MAKLVIGIIMMIMISIDAASFLAAAAARKLLQEESFDMVGKQMVEGEENYGGTNIENHHSCDIPCYNNGYNSPDGTKN